MAPLRINSRFPFILSFIILLSSSVFGQIHEQPNGNVGIGWTPRTKFDVNGDIWANGSFSRRQFVNYGHAFDYTLFTFAVNSSSRYDDVSTGWKIKALSDTQHSPYDPQYVGWAPLRLGFFPGYGTPRSGNTALNNLRPSVLTLYSNFGDGRVGIGTETPNSKLEIKGGIAGDSNSNLLRLSEASGADSYEFSMQSDDYLRLNNGADNATLMSWGKSGNVGIGTSTPRTTLDVNGDVWANGSFSRRQTAGWNQPFDYTLLSFAVTQNSRYNEVSTGWKVKVLSDEQNSPYDPGLTSRAPLRMSFYPGYTTPSGPTAAINNLRPSVLTLYSDFGDGRVGIGTETPTQKLSVAGKINAREIILENVSGADFVFEEDYDLRSLEETEQFIKDHKHLPEIPSAAEMAEEGLQIKEMNILLLQKVEELTLHLIRQEKELTQQRNEANEMRQNTEELQTQLLKQQEEIERLKATRND